MPVNPAMDNSYSKMEEPQHEAEEAPVQEFTSLHNNMPHSEILKQQLAFEARERQQTSNGHVPRDGLTLNMVAPTVSADESELFEPNSPVVVDIFENDEEFFARFNVSQQIDKILNKNRYVSKATFTITIGSIIFLSYCVFYMQWLLLYYYTVALPLLLGMRLVMYCKLKYQYFMLDLCYFINTAMLIYIWVFPHERELATVLFSFNAGPCGLATILFRNSLVIHSIDKMTSTFLHVVPMLVCFVARWYPDVLSANWYTPFVKEEDYITDFDYMAIWLWAVPMGFHIAHMFLYLCLIKIVFKPGPDHDYSFTYLSGMSGSSGGCPGKVITCCNRVGPDKLQIMYCLMTIIYGTLGFIFTPFWYSWFWAHCLVITLVLFVVTWNGSGYYLDVFGPKSFK